MIKNITKDMLPKELIEDFYRVQELAREHLKIITIVNRAFGNLYGFDYNDTDNDPAIDSLEYGTCSIGIDAFLNMMNKASKTFNTDTEEAIK